MSNMNNIAIIFARISRKPDAERGIMSLDSQEHEIRGFLARNNMGVFAVLKSIGSAYRGNQDDIKGMLRSCKRKLLTVYEPNRLSRNVRNFDEIFKICKRNKHKIAIVNRGETFDCQVMGHYRILRELIVQAQKESEDMGARISRTARFKRDRIPAWGKMRDERDSIVDNPLENKITRLVRLLGTAGSSIREITRLVEEVGNPGEGVEPFEFEEYTVGESNDIQGSRTPSAMSVANIVDTFRIYGIRKRRAKWTPKDIREVLTGSFRDDISRVSGDDLCDDFNSVLRGFEVVEPVVPQAPRAPEFTCFWYDPRYGVPQGIRIPDGMILPNTACEVYVPK